MLWLAARRAKSLDIYGDILSVVGILLFAAFIVVKCGLIPETMFHGHHAENVENVDVVVTSTRISFGAAAVL